MVVGLTLSAVTCSKLTTRSLLTKQLRRIDRTDNFDMDDETLALQLAVAIIEASSVWRPLQKTDPHDSGGRQRPVVTPAAAAELYFDCLDSIQAERARRQCAERNGAASGQEPASARRRP